MAKTLAELMVKMGLDARGMDIGGRAVQARLRALNSQVQGQMRPLAFPIPTFPGVGDLGAKLTLGVTAPLLAGGAAAAKMAADFDGGMARIQAATGATAGSATATVTFAIASAPTPSSSTPPSSSAPSLTTAPVGPVNVTSSNQASLTQTPGAATAVVNGQPVTVAVETPADLPAAQVDPEDRSPAQVAALQTAADNLVSQLNQSAGGNSGLAVQDTPTGAAITGLLDKPVPIENTVLVEAGTKSTLFAALNQDGSVTEVQPGAVIEVLGDGQVGVVASGLTPGETAEFVIMSTPTLLGSYTVSANGTIKAQTSLPDGIGLGNHTLVVASPTVQASLGLKVSATPSTLPATGASSSNTMQIAMFLMVGGLMVAFLRRRRHILN
jgi:LPXTG-motif cell wall-anchored protein